MQQPPHPPHPVKKYHLKGGGLPGECVCVGGGGGWTSMMGVWVLSGMTLCVLESLP